MGARHDAYSASLDLRADSRAITTDVSGLRAVVPRYAAVRYKGFDPRGRAIRREVTGFHARVVQHECDHLDGILYPMRMTDMRRFGYTEILFPDSAGEEDQMTPPEAR